jgi:hypothetical protein
MLSEILFVLLVLVVAALMAVDLIRTRGESSHGHADRQVYGADRLIAAPLRSSGASVFSPEPARSVATAPASAAVPPAVAIPATAAGLSARQDEATRAFDQTYDQTFRETSRSAASDGDRDRFNIFVNLSHRSQSLVDRQLRLIEDLEHGERDARRLTSLSKLNRIAVRIYRNSQNLLILAGHQQSPQWNQPVTLVQLVRAALAEVEDYERVSSDIQADVAVRGPAVNDLVHLLVELIENATSFSAAEMPVHIKAQILTTGGALVDITDRGIGMAANEMAYANQQLDNPPAADIDVPKWMGLLVVSRLAARHGIRVRLNQAELGGLIALVWLPDEILTHQGAAADPGPFAEQRAAAAKSAAFAPARVNMPDASAARPDPAWSARGSRATVQAASAATVRLAGPGRPDAPSGDVGVVVPHAESHSRTRGLPIFDEVESRWSRGGHEASGPAGRATASGPATTPGPAAAGPATGGPAGDGPAAGGLPRRPSAATQAQRTVPSSPPGAPSRPGTTGRDGSTAFQRGAGQSRTAPADEGNTGGSDES